MERSLLTNDNLLTKTGDKDDNDKNVSQNNGRKFSTAKSGFINSRIELKVEIEE